MCGLSTVTVQNPTDIFVPKWEGERGERGSCLKNIFVDNITEKVGDPCIRETKVGD